MEQNGRGTEEITPKETKKHEEESRGKVSLRSKLGELLQFEATFIWTSDALNKQSPWIFFALVIILMLGFAILHYWMGDQP